MYEIFLSDANGTRTDVLTDFINLRYILAVNTFASAVISLPGDIYSLDDFPRNGKLGIERNGISQGGAPWFIRRKNRTLNDQGEYIILVEAFHSNYLLDNFWTMYYAGNSHVDVSSQPIDNVMRMIIRYNMGEYADDSNRDLAWPGLVTVEMDRSEAGNITKGFARRKVSNVLAELAETSRQNGIPLFYGIVYENGLKFKVKTLQWGLDRTSTAIVSPEFGNIDIPSRGLDYASEVTVAYALGQGEEVSRRVAYARNLAVLAENNVNWIEEAINANSISLATSLQAEAEALLTARRARSAFGGTIRSTPSFEYGVDWGLGDRLRSEFGGETIDVWANIVSVNVAGGEEQITGTMEVADD